MSERPKFPRDVVRAVFDELWRLLDPLPAAIVGQDSALAQCPHALCDRLCAVGSFRRRKAEMKDLELLYIPRIAIEADPGDLLGATREVNVTERLWEDLLSRGVLAKREKSDGSISAWGPWNKHALHVASGLPIDLFAATEENWWNRLVVTTGSAESNIAIAQAAHEHGLEWEVNEAGFVARGGTWESSPRTRRTVRSERDVFSIAGLEFKPPEAR